MKQLSRWALILLLAVSCKKSAPPTVAPPPPPPAPIPTPAIEYRNLGDSSIAFGRLGQYDLDNNGEKDVLFGTQLVGDPIEQKDKKQWMVTSSFYSHLPVNSQEQIPVLSYSDSILVTGFPGYSWYNASHILLVQKTIPMTGNPYWEGEWKQANHKFVPIQVNRAGLLYNGWIELSFSMVNEKLVLHKAALCKVANATVKAGQ